MIEKPPKQNEINSSKWFYKYRRSEEIKNVIRKAQKDYVYWEKFKYFKFPENFTPEEAWSALKFVRMDSKKTPIISTAGENFKFNFPDSLYQKLYFIDTHSTGLLQSLNDRPINSQVSKYIISNLTEEAIASSQIEGANTTHKIAKEMIMSQRKPRNKNEQMIVNNYLALQKMDEWKDMELTEEMLLDLQRILMNKTTDDPDMVGRFRKDSDDIVVNDPLTGETAHVPPNSKKMLTELKKFLSYANKGQEEDGEFMHPVIKASILHFWFAYLHPFVDGNGRSARAIFYWYLLKNNYWLIAYISVSRAIKQNRNAYDKAFLYSENDENDLTYFLYYIADTFEKAIKQFLEHFEKRRKEDELLKSTNAILGKFNFRQIALLKYFLEHCDKYTDVITHQNKHGISRPSSYNDLKILVGAGFLTETKKSKRMVYMPIISKIKKVFKQK